MFGLPDYEEMRTFKPECVCHQCLPDWYKMTHMILCPECGKKRCPRANDHRNECTNSNATGQPGSAY
jgi:hypothetical protein